MMLVQVEHVAVAQVGASGGLYALSLAVVVAAIYLALVRFMDLNEKEPLWAVGLIFVLGTFAAGILSLVVPSEITEMSVLGEAISEETAKFVAFGVGAAILAAVARQRGWSEINGLMDGIVYGTAAGFGFAVGDTFVRELTFSDAFGVIDVGPLATLLTTALFGLSSGLFGAFIGAGFGAAAGARSPLPQVGYPVAGLISAILVHLAYIVLANGNSLQGGTAAFVRTWISLLIPLVFVVAVVFVAQRQERRAIREELSGERESGAVTEEELAVLESFVARRAMYAKTFVRGDFDGWQARRELHNRQIQLALAKRRASRERVPERQDGIEAEVERLRAAVLAMKSERQEDLGTTDTTGRVGA